MTEHLLVSTEWLAEHLHDEHLRIVDIRGHVIPATEPPPHYFNHHTDYLKSHLPNAVFIDWVKGITDPEDPRHAQIAKPERYAAVMSQLGIDENTFVVAYDDANGMFAARLWWSLNYYGHSKVAVLDGGWDKWIAEDRPTTDEIPDIQPTNFIAKPQPVWKAEAAHIQANLDGSLQLMDVRSPAEFNGQASRTKRMGHIPSALNLPRRNLLNSDGTLLPPEQLRNIIQEAGFENSDKPIVTYCNGGVSASYGLLALRAAGFENSAMYDGSWKEWGNDEKYKIE